MISIVIRTKNSAATLAQVLEKLVLAEGDELLVVDSGSTDQTLDIAARFKAKLLRYEGLFNYGRALNFGFAAATNTWVLSLSSHCIPLSSEFLAAYRQAIAAFPREAVVAYGPAFVTAPRTSVATPLFRLFDRAPGAHAQSAPGGNANALYRRTAWQAQPFSETLPTGEDLDWFLRAMEAGSDVALVSAAAVLYRNQGGLSHMFRKGLQETRVRRALTGSGGLSVGDLGISLGSLMKRFFLRQLPLSAFAHQAAHSLGVFVGSFRNS